HDISGSDLECLVIDVANLGIRQLPGPAIDRLHAVLEATVAPQELYPCSRPCIVEGTGVSFVEVDPPGGVGSARVGQHDVAPFLSGPWSPCPCLPLGYSPAKSSIVQRLMRLTRWFWSHILAFCRSHTSVAILMLWLGFDAQRCHRRAGAPERE